jgi:hypothetical protein
MQRQYNGKKGINANNNDTRQNRSIGGAQSWLEAQTTNNKQQSTVLSTYLVEEGGSRQMSQWTLKSAIVDSLGITEVVGKEKVIL